MSAFAFLTSIVSTIIAFPRLEKPLENSCVSRKFTLFLSPIVMNEVPDDTMRLCVLVNSESFGCILLNQLPQRYVDVNWRGPAGPVTVQLQVFTGKQLMESSPPLRVFVTDHPQKVCVLGLSTLNHSSMGLLPLEGGMVWLQGNNFKSAAGLQCIF